jgi:nitrate reductase alpha subunit
MPDSLLGRRRFFRDGLRPAAGWSALARDGREWESFYRDRRKHDRVVRSTLHGLLLL